MPQPEYRHSLEKLLGVEGLVLFHFEAKEDLSTRTNIAHNAVANIQRFLRSHNPPDLLDLPSLIVDALREIAQDPMRAYYGPGNEHILTSIKTRIKEFLDNVKSGAMQSSQDALALAFTYEACELYEEAFQLYRYIFYKMDEKMYLARDGAQRVGQKLEAHRILPELPD